MAVDIKGLLREARLPEKTVEVCLRGDLASEYEALQEKRAQLPKTDSLSGNPEAHRIGEQMDALREQMAAATLSFKLRALRRRDFQALWDKHPPRRSGNDLDQVDDRDYRLGFNRATFPDDLLRACVIEPELDAEDWKLLDEALNDGQFAELWLTALGLNRREVDVPFSLADSPPTPD